MQVSEEEFAEWRQHPVTEYVLDLMTRWAERQKDGWAEIVWSKGEIDPLLLREAQTRADCYMAIPDTDLAGWLAIEEQLSDTAN